MMPAVPSIAIVIVTHNSGEEIGECLHALRDLSNTEIVVIDNASTDQTREAVISRGIRLIANPTNAGFAAAVNAGVRATTAPLVLLLNPDAHLIRGIDTLATHFENPQTGAAGGMLVTAEGHPQAGFMARNLPSPGTLICEVLGINRLFPANSLNWHYRCKGLDPMLTAVVEQPAGAFLMFPRAVWEKLGGFDERFWPIWFEDVDFCARIKADKLKVYYEPKAVASHTGGHSIATLARGTRERYWYGSLLEYSAKHYPPAAFRAVCLAVILGSGARALRGLTRGSAQVLEVYGRVAGLALGWFFRARTSCGVRVGQIRR
jgi:N-acetylglucosaminyl-diphospho-decaprenol L-rhamnosyltransferase